MTARDGWECCLQVTLLLSVARGYVGPTEFSQVTDPSFHGVTELHHLAAVILNSVCVSIVFSSKQCKHTHLPHIMDFYNKRENLDF